MILAATSTLPPGGYGTTIFIGWLGHWAACAPAPQARASEAANHTNLFTIVS
jgi:hypothetical protein